MNEWLYCELIPTTVCQLCYRLWCVHNPIYVGDDDDGVE